MYSIPCPRYIYPGRRSNIQGIKVQDIYIQDAAAISRESKSEIYITRTQQQTSASEMTAPRGSAIHSRVSSDKTVEHVVFPVATNTEKGTKSILGR